MKTKKDSKNINKNSGNRLKECREYRNLTQEKFSELVNYTPNYISNIENGIRRLSWDNAIRFSQVLNVSPNYLMCISDNPNIKPIDNFSSLSDLEPWQQADTLFLKFFISMGHTLLFHVVNLYEHAPYKTTGHYDFDSISKKVLLSDLQDFSLSDSKCKLSIDNTLSEVIIIKVTIDNFTTIDFGTFIFFINRIYDYINFSFQNLNTFVSDFGFCRAIGETGMSDLSETPKGFDNLSTPIERISKNIKDLEKEYGKGAFTFIEETQEPKK